jgi:hypothetical protein
MDYRKGNYLLSYIDCRSFKKNKLYKILDANVIKMSISADGEWIEKYVLVVAAERGVIVLHTNRGYIRKFLVVEKEMAESVISFNAFENI